MQSLTAAPGPGNYHIPLSTFTKSKFTTTFGRKKRKLSGDQTHQGPEFLPQKPFFNRKQKNAFSFGKSKLTRVLGESKKHFPGPGQYNSSKFLQKKKHPRCVIGSAKRVLGRKENQTPGVGSYNTELAFKSKKRGFSIGRRKRFKSVGVRLTRNTSPESVPRPIW